MLRKLAIRHAQVRVRSFWLTSDGLGHHGTRPAGEPGDSRQRLGKRDDEAAPGTIVTSFRIPRNANDFGIRHAHDRVDPLEYLKLKHHVRRGIVVAVVLTAVNLI